MSRSSTARTVSATRAPAGPRPTPAIGEDPREPAAARGKGKVADLWLGTQLRSLRKAKGLSLAQVGQSAGLSIGMVSQIERGLASPSIRSLRKLADALDVPVAWFFHADSGRPEAELKMVVRREDRRQLRLPTVGTNADLVAMDLLTPDLSGDIQLLMMTLEPGFTSGEAHKHRGEEAGLVMTGTLRLWHGDQEFLLNQGDSFRFASSVPHRYANAGDGPTEVVWVLSPPLV
ncbi:cupin domain-containing protein [Stella sp.]|uniref:cupin domain-containing protein n=1 Tax=Stella sp. TaxID=2912054 RepID=UPI0035B42E98